MGVLAPLPSSETWERGWGEAYNVPVELTLTKTALDKLG
jgi:hypothetical protein